MIILEDIFSTIGATGHLACDINTTRWARSCAVAYLMTAFWTLYDHIAILQFDDLQFYNLFCHLTILQFSGVGNGSHEDRDVRGTAIYQHNR